MTYSSSVVFGVYKMKVLVSSQAFGWLFHDKFLKRHRHSRREGRVDHIIDEIFSFLR